MSSIPPTTLVNGGTPFSCALIWAEKPVGLLPRQVSVSGCDTKRRNGLHYAAAMGDVMATADLLERGEFTFVSTDLRQCEKKVGIEKPASHMSSLRSPCMVTYNHMSPRPLVMSTRCFCCICNFSLFFFSETGVNVRLQDLDGNSPLHVAVNHQSYGVMETLIETGGAAVNVQNNDGLTPLYLASQNGDEKAVKILLEAGANPNIASVEEAAPLHIAAANNFVKIINMLLAGGAYANAEDICGDSALHWAVREGREEAINALLQDGRIEVDMTNEDGETAYEMAVAFDMPRIAARLMNAARKE